MPAPPSRTFRLDVPGVGAFAFRRRTLGDEIAIASRYDALVGEVTNPSPLLDSLASAAATLRVLTVEAPIGWGPGELLDMDLLDEDRTGDLLRVYGALCAREDEFRPPEKRRFTKARPGHVPDAGGVVPPEVRPPAD